MNSRFDDEGPAMLAVTEPKPSRETYIRTGYLIPEPAEIVESTRPYIENLVTAIWQNSPGHVSKTDLETALMNVAGYAYSRGNAAGWNKALTTVHGFIQELQQLGY